MASAKRIFLALLASASVLEVSGALCGCADCNVTWTPQGATISAMVMTMDCETLNSTVASVMTITPGMPCSTLLSELAGATLMGLQISDYIVKAQTSCPSDLTVSIPGATTAGTSTTRVPEDVLSGAFLSCGGKLAWFGIFFSALF